jgi:hypothetical protein
MGCEHTFEVGRGCEVWGWNLSHRALWPVREERNASSESSLPSDLEAPHGASGSDATVQVAPLQFLLLVVSDTIFEVFALMPVHRAGRLRVGATNVLARLDGCVHVVAP